MGKIATMELEEYTAEREWNISVVVPFYNGNQFIERLLASIELTAKYINSKLEVILVNDSPEIQIELPERDFENLDILIYNNSVNMGIHNARINGIKRATGEWLILLDQDDELVPSGFVEHIKLSRNADVVVGNGLYQYGINKVQIYKSLQIMKYLIRKRNFIKIRNLIPSPGECLIRKAAIPQLWMNTPLKFNGADDWFLWLLLFVENRIFVCNDNVVYVHNETGGANLSYDLDKMKESCDEMLKHLRRMKIMGDKELYVLQRAIGFKYLLNTKKIKRTDWIKFIDIVLCNIIYKIRLMVG